MLTSGEAVEEALLKPLGAEHLGPDSSNGRLVVTSRRAPLVALSEHLEQELGTGLGQRHEAEFVDDQKLVDVASFFWNLSSCLSSRASMIRACLLYAATDRRIV